MTEPAEDGMSDQDLMLEPPAPRRDFVDRLRERLRALDASEHRPSHFWALVAAYAGAGAALILIAVAGVGV